MRFNNKNVVLPEPAIDNRFRLEAVEASQIQLASKSSAWTTFEYSIDNGTNWYNFTTSTNIALNAGEKAYFRAKQTNNSSNSNYTKFIMSGKLAAKGNIMHLYDYEHPEITTLTYNYCFYFLFFDCTALVEAPNLPATTLSENCYRGLFYNTMIITPPVLLATTLAKYCCRSMFQNCSSLVEAPVLFATTLVQECYYNMFGSCSLLNKVTTYAQNISALNCLTDWLWRVSSTGDFYNLGGANYPYGLHGIPSNWTVHTSLPLYTEYRYLQFTSNSDTSGSLFNSGYYANANTKIVLKCILQNSENGNTGQGILGTRASASDSNAWLISWAKTDSIRGRYYGNTGTGAKYDASSSHNRLTNEITITMTMSTATITDGTTTYTINFGTTSRGTTSDPLILGGWWAGDANKYLSMLGYWGECLIYENDVLLHDFVPCTRISDNTVGLWDKSTDAFITPIDTNYIPTPVNSAS